MSSSCDTAAGAAAGAETEMSVLERQPLTSSSQQTELPRATSDHLSCDDSENNQEDNNTPAAPPVGKWRDGLLWDYFKHGVCHCSVLNSCCCTLIGAGQVITRLQLTWLGIEPKNNNNREGGGNSDATTTTTTAAVKYAFQKLLYLVLGFWVTRLTLLLIIALLDPNVGNSGAWIEPGYWYYFFAIVDDFLALIYFGFSVLLLTNLRSYVRNKFNIPKQQHYNLPRHVSRCCSCCTHNNILILPKWFCEDCCCSCLCPCLVVAQMMRHTTDYSTQRGRCCTTTGLSRSS